MALEATFRALSVSLHKLDDALSALHLTVMDKPNEESALVDGLDNSILDLIGTLSDARKSASQARRAVGHPVDLDGARRALTVCQERFHRIEQQFTADLVSYEKLKELARLGRVRRHEWLPWANSTKQVIEQCREPLVQASKALAACWQELAERLGTMSISVKTHNVGQQITMPRRRAEDVEIEGVT
jgi:hypothetical protein